MIGVYAEERRFSDMKKVILCLFFLYCLILAEILFGGRTADSSMNSWKYILSYSNVCPFATVGRYISFFLRHGDCESFCLAMVNIGGNFILFMPMGIFLPVLFPFLRHFRQAFFVILLLVLLSEFFQGFFRIGIPDIDDLLVNMSGACVGILVGRNFSETCHRKPFVRIHFD